MKRLCDFAIALCAALLMSPHPPLPGADLALEITAESEPACVAFDPVKPEFAVGRLSGKFINIWSAETGKEARTLRSHASNGVLDLAYSPDGKLLASVGRDQLIHIWYVGNGREICALKGHQKDTNAVAFSRDGTRLASGGADKTLILWDVRTGQMIRKLERHSDGIMALCFSPDGRYLASAGADLAVRIWEADSGNWLRTMKGPVLPITCLAFTPDSKRIACGDQDGRVYIYQAEDGKFVKNLGQHTWGGRSNWPITSILFFSDGKQMITAATDGTVKVWDMASGKFVHTIRAHVGGAADMALSAKDKLLVTVGGSEPVRAAEGYKISTTWSRPDEDPKKTAKVWDASSIRTPLSHPTEPTPGATPPKPDKAARR
ncbi:MAG: WD40 repeat domain-containing protein [Planctomycetota bacterium]